MMGKTVSDRFTLIELVVVVAILMILLTLLFKAMDIGKERMKENACINNHRVMTSIAAEYTSDNSGFYPPHEAWFNKTYEYLGAKEFVNYWRCPVNPDDWEALAGEFQMIDNGAFYNTSDPDDNRIVAPRDMGQNIEVSSNTSVAGILNPDSLFLYADASIPANTENYKRDAWAFIDYPLQWFADEVYEDGAYETLPSYAELNCLNIDFEWGSRIRFRHYGETKTVIGTISGRVLVRQMDEFVPANINNYGRRRRD